MKILHGDCLNKLKELPDNSVDAVVTDPPYGLSFMGKKWDYDVPSEAIWRECLRVLKPGGHLLAFAGTRTQHRMAVRIEDAGFEIRDCIMWVYSQGFPKNLNIGCKCNGNDEAETNPECNMRQVRDANVSKTVNACEKQGEILFEGLSECGVSVKKREQSSPSEIWGGQPRMERRCDVLPETRKLQTDKICAMPEGILVDGEKRRVCDGTSTNHGAVIKSPIDEDRGCSSSESQPAGQQTGEFRIISEQQGAQDRRSGEGRICATCGGIIDYIGWGTALKPATEIITVARKPLSEKTVAANVLKWGTGAINIDGGRVAFKSAAEKAKHAAEWDRTWTNSPVHAWDRATGNHPGKKREVGDGPKPTAGRFPANLIHDGSDEVLELFPAEKDKSAARFFYCAKASKRDRDEGCDSLEKKPGGSNAKGYTKDIEKGIDRNRPRGNCHPTVKPTDLMRYLCRLVTPPGGVVLDPFMGSGTTGKAAQLEGFDFIGIERESEYVEIARARIAAVTA